MKKLLFGLSIALGLLVSISAPALAQTVSATSLLKLVGTGLVPVSSSWHIGSASTNGVFNNLTISGSCSGAGCGSGGGSSFGQGWEINASNQLAPTTTLPIYVASSATSTIANLGGTLDASAFSGSDIGAKSNSAYSSAASYGTALNIPAPTSGNSWSFTTGIAANTASKSLRIVCAVGGGAINYATNGTVLLYTGTTGTSTKFNTGQGPNESGSASGMINCNLQGTNGTTARPTTGVEEGGNNGDFNGYLDGVNVSGFGTGVYMGQNTSFNTIRNATINLNGRNVSEPSVGGANCENERVLDSIIADANNQTGGDTDLKGYYVQVSGNCQLNMALTSLDDNQLYLDQYGGTANITTELADHGENPNGHAYPMVGENSGATSVVYNAIGGDKMNDDTSGQADQIEATGWVNLLGFTSDANNNVSTPVTRVVNALASSTQIVWVGSQCLGANSKSFVYGNVPCVPLVIGSDYWGNQPSLFVATSTASQIGRVGIGTDNPFKLLTIGANNTGTFAISTSTSGCASFSSIGELYSTGTACGSGGSSGTVTSVATDATLTGGPITTTGTLGLNLSNANIWTGLQQFSGNFFAPELTLATSTTMSLGIASSSQQLIRYSTSAITIAISAYQLTPGMKTVLTTCDQTAGTGGAITFSNLHYSGGVQPGNTTAANQCDMWYITVTNGTSTPIAVLTGMTPGIQ